MLSKSLQIVGLLFSIAGLLGERRLKSWDSSMRNVSQKLSNIKSSFLKIISFYYDMYSSLPSILELNPLPKGTISKGFLITCAVLFWVFALLTSKPILSRFGTLVINNTTNDIMSFVLWAFIIVTGFLYPFLKLYYVFSAEISHKEKTLKGKIALMGDIIRLGFLKGGIGVLTGVMFFVYFSIPITGVVFILFSASDLIIRIIFLTLLFPYNVLDIFANKIKIQSTILLIGLLIELIGIIIQ